MAGSYPDAPSHRLAFDDDGSIVWETSSIAGGTFGGAGLFTGMTLPPTELSVATRSAMNSETSTDNWRTAGGPGAVDYGYGWIWPEKRDIYGFYGYACSNAAGHIGEIHTSTNSRNAITGSFTTEAASNSLSPSFGSVPTVTQPDGTATWSVEHSYRELIHPLNTTGTTAVRCRVVPGKTVPFSNDKAIFSAFHWYGEIADGANPDRVLFIDQDTGLEFNELQDWGDIPRGTVHEKEIKLYNNSATLSASSNVITFEGLTGDSFEWYSIQDNSSTAPSFSTALTINGPISPGASYPASTETLTLRLTVDPIESLGPNAARLQMVTGVWS